MDDVWHTGLPVVVRRDVDEAGRIPVGVRGMKRCQRAAGWVNPDAVTRVCTPELLVDPQAMLRSPFISQPPVQVALLLSQQAWPWTWGITGSTGYALATGIPVIHASSDLGFADPCPAGAITRGAGKMAATAHGRSVPR